ncbi:MAG: thermonuclease family protein [Candidatus Omnitrophota bacterium]|nr:MAG: thermonuclease family protein [Candidatus Omnitrophota bacterium]
MIKKLFFLLLFLISCTCPQKILQDYSHIKVTEVIDGDTVKLANGKFLRYLGIDTPEVRLKEGGRFIYSPQPFAKEAKRFNQRLVEGKFVRVEFDVEKTDKYRRLLGYCFLNDTFVNAVLVKEGFACVYTRPPNVKYADVLVDSQRKARKEKRGMWGVYETVDHSAAHRYINQIRTVKGKVVGTYKSSNCVFLNFGYDYKTDFTVVIFNDSLKYFQKERINPAVFYKGKTIAVSGRIREHNGPQIIVNVPGQIEIYE